MKKSVLPRCFFGNFFQFFARFQDFDFARVEDEAGFHAGIQLPAEFVEQLVNSKNTVCDGNLRAQAFAHAGRIQLAHLSAQKADLRRHSIAFRIEQQPCVVVSKAKSFFAHICDVLALVYRHHQRQRHHHHVVSSDFDCDFVELHFYAVGEVNVHAKISFIKKP